MLPAYAARMKPQVAVVTLEQVLTHTAGFVPDEAANSLAFVRAADPVAAILAGGSGEGAFAYSSAGAQLMSAILVEATGMSVLRYARTKLFDPLGIDTRPASELLVDKSSVARYEAADFAWPVDRAGLHLAFSGLKLQADDLVKIGQLYLNQGQWEGKQIVPATWVKAATAQHADTAGVPMDGYGFQWWVGDMDGTAAYMAWGYGGQMIQVVPAHRLVVAVTTDYRPDDPHSPGINPGPLTYLIKSAVVSAFTDKTRS
jgi:CubicO group peptidase (beta-lactamase class C family)